MIASDPVTGADVPAALVPAGTTFPATTAGLTLRRLSGNRIEVTASDAVNTYVVAGRVPGLTVAPALTVTVAVLRPGVITLPDERVAFPSTAIAPGTGEPLIGPLVTESGVGPFTWAEVTARISAPNGQITLSSLAELDTLEFHYPVVIDDTGVIPDVGDLVVGTGSSGVSGEVVEPAGASTLRRNGYVLLTVRIAGPAELFRDLFYDLRYDDLAALGVVEAPATVGGPAEGEAGRAAGPGAFGFNGRTPSVIERFVRAGAAARTAPMSVPPPDPTTPPAPDPDPNPDPPEQDQVASSNSGTLATGGSWRDRASDCGRQLLEKGNWDASLVETNILSPNVTVTPVFNVLLDVSGFTVRNARLELGINLNATARVSIRTRLAANVGSECTLGRLSDLRVAMPGPLAALVELFSKGDIVFKPAVKVEGGPQLEAGIQCTFVLNVVLGFAYRGDAGDDGFSNLSNASSAGTGCQPVWNLNLGIDDSSVAFLVEPTVMLETRHPMGSTIGGVVGRWIGRVLALFGRGSPEMFDATLVSNAFGPQLRATYENRANMLNARSASTFAGGEFVGKSTVELATWGWAMKKLTGTFNLLGTLPPQQPTPDGNADSRFELTIVSFRVPVLTAYAPLNTAGVEVTVGGDTVDAANTVYVQVDDDLVVTSPLAPSTGGVTLGTPQLTGGSVYQRFGITGATASWSAFETLGAPTAIASTGTNAAFGRTTLRLSTRITQAMCDEMRTARELALVGVAPLGFGPASVNAYGWGGMFTIQCVDGTIEWSQSEIRGIGAGDLISLNLTTSGSRPDSIRFEGIPLLPEPWLEVVPREPITVRPQRELPEGETRETFTIDFGYNISVNPSDCLPPRTATIVATSETRGTARLTVTEHDGCYLRFTRTELTGPGLHQTTLVTEGASGEEIDFAAAAAALPDWVELELPAERVQFLPRTRGAPTEIRFGFRFREREPNCGDQLERTATLRLGTLFRGSAEVRLVDPAVPAREGCGFRFDPAAITGPGSTSLTLVDDRVTGDERFAIAQIDPEQIPEWMTVTFAAPEVFGGGYRMSDGTSLPVTIAGEPPYDECEGRPQRRVPVFADARLPYEFDLQGVQPVLVDEVVNLSATLFVTYPAIPAADCGDGPSSTGGAWGDPHAWSFDGAHWEAQTVGEYVYAEREATPARPGLRVTARHKPSAAQAPPTSIFAVAVEYDEHSLEVYATSGAPDIFVDGVLRPLNDGETVQLVDGFSVSRSGGQYLASTPGVQVKITQYFNILDLSVTAAQSSGVRGMLGVPNGTPADDFVGRDGTVYTPAQMSLGFLTHPVEFESFVDSWRIRDPQDSPFTRTDAVFLAPNPGYDASVMEEFAAQADALIVESGLLCATPEITLRNRYALALELSIGTPAHQMHRFSCRYAVEGTITSDGAPVPGVEVTIDADGLQPCTVTSGADGRYSCVTTPDFTEAADNPTISAETPLVVQVRGRWAGRAAVLASGTAAFGQRASSEGEALTRTVDLSVDPALVPSVVLQGAVRLDGVPLRTPRDIDLVGTDASGARVFTSKVRIAPDEDGTYRVRVVVPATVSAVRATMNVETPRPEQVSVELGDLQPGANLLTLSFDVGLVRAAVSGVIEVLGVPLPGPRDITTTARLPGGATVDVVTPIVVTADGSYAADVVLPLNALSAWASTNVGRWGSYRTAEQPVAAGVTAFRLDVAHDTTTIEVRGSVADRPDDPVLADAFVSVRWFRGTADAAFEPSLRATPAADGGVVAPAEGPPGADRAVVTVRMRSTTSDGPGLSDEHVVELTGLVPGTRVVEVVHDPVVIDLSGRALDSLTGTPLTGPAGLTLRTLDAAGNELGTRFASITLAADGTYRYVLSADRRTASAEIRLQVSPNSFTRTATGLQRGVNPITFDVGLSAPTVTVTGRLTSGDPPARIAPTAVLTAAVRNEAGQAIGTYQPTVALAPDGSYSWTQQLPETARSVTVTARVGGGSNTWTEDWPSTTASVAPGGNTITFTRQYAPATLTVSGVAQVDGVALSEVDLTVRTFHDGNTTQVARVQTLRVTTTGTDGRYTATFTLPLPTTSATVMVADTVNSVSDGISVEGVVAGAATSRTLDLVVQPVRFTARGTASWFGEPLESTGMTLTARGFNEVGQLVDVRTFPASTDVDSRYSTAVTLRQGVRRVELRAEAFVIGPGYAFFVPLAPRTFTGFVDGTNPDVFYDPSLIAFDVAGTITGEGADRLTDLPVRMTVTTPDGVTTTDLETSRNTESGEFFLQGFTEATATNVRFQFLTLPGVAPIDVVPTGGRTPVTWNVELGPDGTNRTLRVHGAFPQDLGGSMEISVRPIVLDPDRFQESPPFDSFPTVVVNGQPGAEPDTYEAIVDLPGAATHAVVEVYDGSRWYPAEFVELATGTDEFDLVVNYQPESTWEFEYTPVGQDDCVATLLTEMTVWWFPSEPADTSNGDPSTWPGGIPLGTRVLVPDLTGISRQRWWVPGEPGWVSVGIGAWSGYGGRFNTGIGFALNIEPGSGGGFGEIEFGCSPP